MASLTVKAVSKAFASSWKVLDGISLDVTDGEFVTLLGPSGCGKTTLLKAIAGFHPVSDGRILIDGQDVTDLPPERRDTAMCFQSYALFPHMSVAENILFGPRQSRVEKHELPKLLENALRQVDLAAHADKLPGALSGGQQQRVALARAMAMRPGIILFDEPLSNLDAKLREQVRLEIRSLQAELGFTAIYVTHDQSEALAMSDRIVILNGGKIAQVGTPDDIYRRPATRFVADFIGAANLLRGKVTGREGDDGWRLQTELGPVLVRSTTEPVAEDVYLCWRPEDAEVVGAEAAGQANAFTLRVTNQAFLGNVTDVFAKGVADGPTYRIQTRGRVAGDAELLVRIDPTKVSFLESAA